MENTAKQAKLRALRILTRMDKTEADLRASLKRAGFSADDVDKAIEYVKSYGYINDYHYAQNYLEYNKEKKSRQKIRYELLQKGVAESDIDSAFLCCEDYDEKCALRLCLNKRWKKQEKPDEKELRRLFASLSRQGFISCDIWTVLKEQNLT